MTRKAFAIFALLFFTAFTVGAADTQTDESTQANALGLDEISVIDEAGLFGEEQLGTLYSATDNMGQYDLFLLTLEGQSEANYDEDIYTYVTEELADTDGFTTDGLAEDTVLMTMSPDIRQLGIYGGTTADLSPNDVEAVVRAMAPGARDDDWHRAAQDGFGTLSERFSGNIPADEWAMSAMPYLIGALVLIIGGWASVPLIKKQAAKKRAARENKKLIEAARANLSETESFWREVSRDSSVASAQTSEKAKEVLTKIRRVREPSVSDADKDAALLWLHQNADPNDPTNLYLKKDIDYYARRFDWRGRWGRSVDSAQKKVDSARRSLTEFSSVVEDTADATRAEEAVAQAESAIKEADRRVRDGLSPREGERRLDRAINALISSVETVSHARIKKGLPERQLSSSPDSDFNFATAALLYWGIAHTASAPAVAMHSSELGSSSSYSSSSDTSFSSFGTGFGSGLGSGFGSGFGGSGGFGGGGSFSGGSGSY